MSFRQLLASAAVCFLAALANAQQKPAPTASATPAAITDDVQQIVTREFGDDFKSDSAFPVMTGDFDGDGAEDLVIVAKGRNLLGGAMDFHYRVMDPYNGYFGWSNPKDTLQFATASEGPSHCLLVIEDWRHTPKAKYVLIHIPFEQLQVSRASLKKKSVSAIATREYSGMEAVVFWDGKKFRWEPTGSGE